MDRTYLQPKQPSSGRGTPAPSAEDITEETSNFTNCRRKSDFNYPDLEMSKRKSLAHADLMAVFYPPNTISQPHLTDTPFEALVQDTTMSSSWAPTLERAIRSIVSIKAISVRSFDTESSGTYTATGFVVDAQRGLILSNRHVVHPGPIVAQAIFVNYEEVELQPLYRDPVHDFGFFRFDPSRLRFMQVEQITLAPDRARVGMEIRVVGNDAGEKLSILAGTLARLDRAAPDYGTGKYNDFNTFYMQAASGTSGGSSGSPVLDIQGDAVGLNAGGATSAASSFYLPLNRVQRALKLIQEGQMVTRGTVQAEFEHLAFDELRRLGLDAAVEKQMRSTFPESQGMLSVKAVQRDGPSWDILQAGDIVVAVNSRPTVSFDGLESTLDSSVSELVELSLWRGSRAYTARLKVQDMREVTPDRFVELGGGTLNDLSYMVARGYGIPAARGVYVASSGHVLGSAGAWRGSVIVSLDGHATPNIDRLAEALQKTQEGGRVSVRFFAVERPHKEKVAIMDVSTHWHALRMGTRDENTGYWTFEDLERPSRADIGKRQPQNATMPKLSESLGPASLVWPSVVYVDCRVPFLIDGMRSTQFAGPGFIVDKQRGLVVCDRDTVPTSVGDIAITVAGSIVVPGSLVMLHPVYNFAILSYEPQLIGTTAVQEASFHPEHYLQGKKLQPGDSVWLLGVTSDQSPVARHTAVSSRSLESTRECVPPRFRCANVEAVRVHDTPSCLGGVLCDQHGQIMAMWAAVSSQNSSGEDTTVMAGFDVRLLRTTIQSLKQQTDGECPVVRSLDVVLWSMRLAPARSLGLSPQRIQMAEQTTTESSARLLYVLGMAAPGSPAARQLQTGDVVLEMNGKPVSDVQTVAALSQEHVSLVVLRDRKELEIPDIQTTRLEPIETARVVHWLGALIQIPYRAVHEQTRHLPSSVYVSCTLYGSPANCYGLRPGMWIKEVEDQPVCDLDQFVQTISQLRSSSTPQDSLDDLRDARYVRLTVVNKEEVTRVLSLRVDNHYWPPWQLVRDPTAISTSGWKRLPIT